MDLIGRWWNGRYGKLGRRDVWLRRHTIWHVEARDGEADNGRSKRWEYDNQDDAIAMVERLITSDGTDWKDLTGISTKI